MGIQVEFNPDLALRDVSEYEKGNRKVEECIPKDLEAGRVYDFLKKEQRNYWIFGEIPLVKTSGNGILSRPIAGIRILEATHFCIDGVIYTKGKYEVLEVFQDQAIHFECFDRAGTRG